MAPGWIVTTLRDPSRRQPYLEQGQTRMDRQRRAVVAMLKKDVPPDLQCKLKEATSQRIGRPLPSEWGLETDIVVAMAKTWEKMRHTIGPQLRLVSAG